MWSMLTEWMATKLIRSCLERGSCDVYSVRRKAAAWPKAGADASFLHQVLILVTALQPKKAFKHMISLLSSLQSGLEAHRSFAVDRVLKNYQYLWDQGLICYVAQQLWSGLGRRHSVAGLCSDDVFAYICVVALIPCTRQYGNTGTSSLFYQSWIKYGCLPQGVVESTTLLLARRGQFAVNRAI